MAKKASNAKVIWLAAAGAIGGFLFGFDSSVVNGAVNPIAAQFHLSSTVTGLAVASALIGCAVGAVCSPCKEKDKLFHRTTF